MTGDSTTESVPLIHGPSLSLIRNGCISCLVSYCIKSNHYDSIWVCVFNEGKGSCLQCVLNLIQL